MVVWQGRPGRVKASRITGKSAGQEKGGNVGGGKKRENTAERQKKCSKARCKHIPKANAPH